jgi:hypothetical protein
MRELGPRACLKLRGEPLLVAQVRVLRESVPGADVVVVVGCDAGRVLRAVPPGVRVVENENWAGTGTLRSAAIGLRAAPGDAAVVYGDLVFDHAAVLDLDRPGSVVLVGSATGRGVGVNEARGRVTHMDYGRPNQWAQMVRLGAKAAAALVKAAEPTTTRGLLLHEGLNRLADQGHALRLARCSGRLDEVDDPADYRRVAAAMGR